MAGGTPLGGSSDLGCGISPALVKIVLVAMAMSLAGYIVGPPLYWHVAEALGSSSSCPPCAACDCSAQPLLSLPEGSSSTLRIRFIFPLAFLDQI